MAVSKNSTKMLSAAINKAWDCSRFHSVTMAHEDLDFSLEVESREPYVCCLLRRVLYRLSRMS